MRWFSHHDGRSFHFLNATQFLGALNDNVFKLLVIYLLINVKGVEASPSILALAGAIYVIPFLLFSSGAGILADRHSKTRIIVISRALESIVMLFAVFTTALRWEFGSYLALFLMATQSALFGPSKYGIIPELVDAKMISKANSSLTSMTYLSIILGTFLASFLTDITNKNFVLVSCFCLLIALTGLGTSLGIKKTASQQSKKKIHPLFFYEIYQTVRFSWQVDYLLIAIFGSAFFLFVGAFTQLNIIPFAIQSLHLSEVGGGYLFLATAIGIAIGATIAGRISKEKVEPGLAVIAGFAISCFFFTLYLFSSSLTATILSLIFLGISGGCFLIPFDSFIQTYSPNQQRGQIIAVSNFFSFFGVLIAAVVLYLFSDRWGLKSDTGFALMGLLTLISTLLILGRLSNFFLPFFAQRILYRFGTLHITSSLPGKAAVLWIRSDSWLPLLLLYAFIPNLRVLLPNRLFHFPWFNGWFRAFRILPTDPEAMEKELTSLLNKEETIAFFLHTQKDQKLSQQATYLFAKFQLRPTIAQITKTQSRSRFLGIRFWKKEINMTFTTERCKY